LSACLARSQTGISAFRLNLTFYFSLPETTLPPFRSITKKSEGKMFELLAILFIAFIIISSLKLLAFIFQAGFFVIALPLKIIFGVIVGIFGLLLLPVVVIGALLSLLFPLLIIGLGVAGLVYLLR